MDVVNFLIKIIVAISDMQKLKKIKVINKYLKKIFIKLYNS